MFILNKKRILFITITIMISICTVMLSNPIDASSIPNSSHTIIIDAGHGLPDGGATAQDGTSEESINLSISLKLQKLLEQTGSNVILTRSDENGIYDLNAKNKKSSDLNNRVKISNNSNSDIFVSIHLNKINIPSCYGPQTFYSKRNSKSKTLATCIQNNLNENIKANKNRTILPIKGKFLLENINIPSIIVECGFLSNESELNNLKNDSYQDILAWGIYSGIVDYFSNSVL